MARKLRKGRMSLRLLFIELLTPWIVMAIVAVAMSLLGLPDYAVILVALGTALVVTFFIRDFEMKRRRIRSP